MISYLDNIDSAKKMIYAFYALGVLFVFKVIYPAVSDTNITLWVLNELIVFTSFFVLSFSFDEYLGSISNYPITIILTAGILTGLLFVIVTVISVIFAEDVSYFDSAGVISNIVITLFSFLIAASGIFILMAYKGLFYLRQKKDPASFYYTMIIFFILSGISTSLKEIDAGMNYVHDAIFVVTILLILVNSVRVAWIAFLLKKQKITLLGISIIICALSGITFSSTLSGSVFYEILFRFSPGLTNILNLIMIYGCIYFGVVFFTALFHLPTAEAFDRKAQEVSSMMDLGKLITQVFDFRELAETITTTTTKVSNSDSAWLVLQNSEALDLVSVNGIGYLEADALANAVCNTENRDLTEPVILAPAALRNYQSKNPNLNFYKSLSVAPLKVHGKVSGYLFAARSRDVPYDEEDKKAISAFADYAALAVENAKLIQESIEKERMEKELDVAREIQYKILPRETPKCETLDISALFIPAFEVGGDYYDFFCLGDKKLGFVIADVSGKGISAAFVMAEVKGIFESLSQLNLRPAEILRRVNEILKKSLDKKTFVTAIYGIIDTNTGILNFSRAGHTPTLIRQNGTVQKLTPPGLGLGFDGGINFNDSIKELEIKLNFNDIVILYTDGITESQNELNEEFGLNRLEKILEEDNSASIDRLSNKIMTEVTTFSSGKSQHDDITLVIFKWISKN